MKISKIEFIFPTALVLYEVLTYLANDMYLPALPTLENDFDTTESIAKQTLLSWFLGSASMQLFMGPLSDRFGRKRVVLIGALFFILSSFICALTQDINLFLFARFIQGTSVCSVVVAGYATIHELFDTKKAIKMIAIMGSVTVVAPALGPLFGALVLEIAHWRVIFYFLGIGAIVTSILLIFVMPETNPKPTPIHLRSIIRNYWLIAKNKQFLSFTLPYCFLFMALIFWLVESPFLVIEDYHRDTITYGWTQVFVFGGYIIGAQFVGILVHHFAPIKIILNALIACALSGLALIVSIVFFKDNLIFLVIIMTVFATVSSGAFSPLSRLAIEATEHPMGARMGIFASMINFFSVMATLIVSLFTFMNGYYLVQFIALVAMMACFIYVRAVNQKIV